MNTLFTNTFYETLQTDLCKDILKVWRQPCIGASHSLARAGAPQGFRKGVRKGVRKYIRKYIRKSVHNNNIYIYIFIHLIL